MAALKDALGIQEVQGKSGNVALSELEGCTLVGVYFSAHWCPPCRSFTPTLIQAYNKANVSGKKFEIIFVSLDRDVESFDEYYKDMPWLTIPFANEDIREGLAKKFNVKGIPALLFFKAGESEPLTGGREIVSSGQLFTYLE